MFNWLKRLFCSSPLSCCCPEAASCADFTSYIAANSITTLTLSDGTNSVVCTNDGTNNFYGTGDLCNATSEAEWHIFCSGDELCVELVQTQEGGCTSFSVDPISASLTFDCEHCPGPGPVPCTLFITE